MSDSSSLEAVSAATAVAVVENLLDGGVGEGRPFEDEAAASESPPETEEEQGRPDPRCSPPPARGGGGDVLADSKTLEPGPADWLRFLKNKMKE